MSTPTAPLATTPISGQLSETECSAFLWPHLIVWVLYRGMPWKCSLIPPGAHGKPALHDTNVYRAFAKWAHDESLQRACIASVAHLAQEKPLDLSFLHGDGTTTVAKKGAMELGTRLSGRSHYSGLADASASRYS